MPSAAGIVKGIFESLILMDSDFRVLECNDLWLQHVGGTIEDVRATNLTDAFPPSTESDHGELIRMLSTALDSRRIQRSARLRCDLLDRESGVQVGRRSDVSSPPSSTVA